MFGLTTVERREDARGKVRRTPSVDEVEQAMEVDLALRSQVRGQCHVEAGVAEDVAAPREDVGGYMPSRPGPRVG
jgi:hypothetical protein